MSRLPSFSLAATGLAVLLVSGAATYQFVLRRPSTPAMTNTLPSTGLSPSDTPLSVGRDLLADFNTATAPTADRPERLPVSAEMIAETVRTLAKELTWQDVPLTLRSVGRTSPLHAELARAANSTASNPFLFLVAMLELSTGDETGCLNALKLLDAESLPVEFLYGPYRLMNTIEPQQANPFRARLADMVMAQKTGPLIAARYYASEGLLPTSFEHYLQTDPSQWATYDAELLGAIRQHSGLAPDAKAFIAAAIHSGRINEAVAAQLTLQLDDRLASDALAARLQAVLDQPTAYPTAHGAIHQVAREQADIRQQFLEEKYVALTKAYEQSQSATLATETVYLLTLSAAEARDLAAFDRWALELQRRIQDVELRQWLRQIRPAVL